ncbi:Subtilisin inhibitor 1 [Linum grandiflorum]
MADGNNKNNCTTEEEQPSDQPNQPSEPRFSQGRSKSQWPELVGLPAEEAEAKIKQDMGGALVQVVPPNHFVTMDFRRNRVRLYVDSEGKIARAPIIG